MRPLFLRFTLALPLAGALLPLAPALAQAHATNTPAATNIQTPATTAAAPDAPAPSPTLTAARGQIDRGHATDALASLDTLARTAPDTPGLERTRGLALYSLGRLPDADAAFALALAADPHDREAAQMRGLTLFRLGRPAAAIPWLEAAPGWGAQTKADPSYVLALCYIDTRRYDDARHAFAAQFGFPPDSAAAYLLAARMLLRREYLPIAQDFATRALSLDPQLPLAHALLGEIALARNQPDDAIPQFEAERTRDPLDGNLYERLGDAYARSGRFPDAQRVLQQAVLLEPNSTGPYLLLGKADLKSGDAVAAATYLEKAEAMDPANYMTHNLLAQAYRALGRPEQARHELDLTEKIQAADTPKLSSPQ